jgi:hypothetical protein
VNPSLLLSLAAISAARLLTSLPSPPAMSAPELARRAAPGPARASGSRTAETEGDGAPTLVPNPAGIIDLAGELTAAQQRGDEARPVNPFRLRFHAPVAARTVAVTISGVIRTENRSQDCCVLNGQVLRTGEVFEGLILSAISDLRVILTGDRYRLQLPVDDRPITLRLPQ